MTIYMSDHLFKTLLLLSTIFKLRYREHTDFISDIVQNFYKCILKCVH